MKLLKIAESEQFIHFEVQPQSLEGRFFLTVDYGHNTLGSRRELGTEILNLQPTDPWIVTGDFKLHQK